MKKLFFLFLVLAMASCNNPSDKSVDYIPMIIGTYTADGSEGLYTYRLDQSTGSFELLDSCQVVNPSYLTVSVDGSKVYAVSETGDSTAAIYAFDFDASTGKLTVLNHQPTYGTDPCYIAQNGKVAVTANYGGSMSVFPIESNGSVGAMQALYEGATGGPDSVRQATPHVHCAEFSVDGTNLYVSDFSADRLLVFKVDDGGGKITPLITDTNESLAIEVTADYGPRHIVFDKTGKHAYLIGELSGNITVFDVSDGMLTEKQTIEADPVHARGSADIHLSPDGRFLYATNRLQNDGIALFEVDSSTGELTYKAYFNTGSHPRNFNITPNGRFLLCACRDTDSIEIYSVDDETGALDDTGKRIRLSKPVCVKFAADN